MKYIYMRHMDYWYGVYRIGEFKNIGLDEVEFHILDQADKESSEFFHFDYYTLPALTKMIADDDYMESDEPGYPKFLEKYEALKGGELEFFIGSLYYPDFRPNLTDCNNVLLEGKTILDFKSPSYQPYYAVIFIGEEHPLTPDLVIAWTIKLCKALFKEEFNFQIIDIPTVEEALAEYKDDGRFLT